MNFRSTRTYFRSMAVYWGGFGLVTIFAPRVMDLFQSSAGVAVNTAFSDHVWVHCGLDILSLCAVLIALSFHTPHRTVVKGVGVAAMMPAVAIAFSLLTTGYWNPLFAVTAAGCAAFGVWGLLLAAGQAPELRAAPATA